MNPGPYGPEFPDQAEHRSPDERPPCDRVCRLPDCRTGGFVMEYDDGNGLWITSGETPCDLEFLRKYHPQDYTHCCALSSEAAGARGTAGSVRGVMSYADERTDEEPELFFKKRVQSEIAQRLEKMSSSELMQVLGRLIAQGY